jgi:acyl carrier protein
MKEDIRDYVCSDLLLNEDLKIEDDENLLLNGVLDSLALMRLIMHLEDTYDVEIPPAEITLENFASLTAMTEYLENRLGIRAA